MMMFTVEESNLLQIIGGRMRNENIKGLKGILPHIQNGEMRMLVKETMEKLEKMSDREYLEYRMLEMEV